MRTLLMYFSNRLEEAVLKWNAYSRKNVDTNIFMLNFFFLLFLLFLFYFSPPLCSYKCQALPNIKEARVLLLWGQILPFEMQGNFFMCLFTQNG